MEVARAPEVTSSAPSVAEEKVKVSNHYIQPTALAIAADYRSSNKDIAPAQKVLHPDLLETLVTTSESHWQSTPLFQRLRLNLSWWKKYASLDVQRLIEYGVCAH